MKIEKTRVKKTKTCDKESQNRRNQRKNITNCRKMLQKFASEKLKKVSYQKKNVRNQFQKVTKSHKLL